MRELRAVARREGGERSDERGDAPLATVEQELRSARGGAHARDAPVVGVDDAIDQPFRLENHDQLGNRGWTHLLGPGEITESDRTAEDDDGEGGELRGGETGGVVLAAEAPEEVEGGGVEAVGEVDSIAARVGARLCIAARVGARIGSAVRAGARLGGS